MKRGEKNRAQKEQCKCWLRLAGNLPEARRLAKRRTDFTANASVWISALAEFFAEKIGEASR